MVAFPSFEDLKMGLKHMRGKARTRSEGPISFVKTNLAAILDCLDSLNGTGAFEPPRDKTNKMACAPSEDSDQPRHPPSLIRVFAVHMKKPCVLSYPLSAQRRL